MALLITKYDIKDLEYFAALSAANKLKVSNAEFKSVNEMVASIKQLNSRLAVAIESFTKAYRAWYDFLVLKDNQSNLNKKEQQELQVLTVERDETRKNFIDVLLKVG